MLAHTRRYHIGLESRISLTGVTAERWRWEAFLGRTDEVASHHINRNTRRP